MSRREKVHLAAAVFFAFHAVVAVWAFFFNRPLFDFIALFYVVANASYTTAATHWGAYEAARAERLVQARDDAG